MAIMCDVTGSCAPRERGAGLGAVIWVRVVGLTALGDLQGSASQH